MTVRTRLILTFGAVGLLLLLPALFAVERLGDLRDLAVEERGNHAAASQAVGRIEAGLSELERTLRGHLGEEAVSRALGEARGPAGVPAPLVEALGDLDSRVERIREAGYPDAVPPLVEAVDALESEVVRITDLAATEDLEAAEARLPEFGRAVAGVRAAVGTVADDIDTRAREDFERARSISVDARQNLVLAVLVALLLTAALAAWTTGALTAPLRRLRDAMAHVADGQFETPGDLPYDRRDEIGDLAVSFRTMAENLRELDRLKAEFLGVASHELKTPINVIRGYAELIEEELHGDVTEEQRDVLERIVEQTVLLARQVSRLMDISRLETGSYEMEPESVLVEDLLLGLRRAYEILADQGGVTLETRISEDAPERVVVDVDLIRDEVLGNLVSNALKFTPEGGRVDVRASGEGEMLVVEVSDTGPGIPPEHRPHIFEKYYKGERSTAVGSGLGLAIAREMVVAHGGSISLEDDDAPGTTFRVRLPVEGEGMSAEAAIPHEERGLEREQAASA